MRDDPCRTAAVVDFESLPIRQRPLYPPKAVGVATWIPGQRAKYLAWGHLSGNNSTWCAARQHLGELIDSGRPLIFQNAKFDLSIIEEEFQLKLPGWERIYDTLPLMFIDEPRAPTFSLKPSGERILGREPDERDALVDWLVQHQPVPDIKLSDKQKGKHYAGAYVAWAPPHISGPYACEDTLLARDIFRKVFSRLDERSLEAYTRERRLLPHIMEAERRGIRVDVKRLTRDIEQGEKTLIRVDGWLRLRLKCKDLNIDSSRELAAALLSSGAASRELLGITSSGEIQTNKEALARGVIDKQVHATLRYRSQLRTCLRTFMMPWLETALDSNGFIYTTWHTTRTERKGGGVGARTGRLTSTPNFQNIPVRYDPLFKSEEKGLPPTPIQLPQLPRVRQYIIPTERGWVLCDRDYSQQELRILGHFEDGVLRDAYIKDPWLDVHDHAQKLINGMLGTNYKRKPVKNTGFGIIYGMGLGKLAEQTNSTVEQAQKLRRAYLSIFPGLRSLDDDLKRRARQDEPLRTWGGRLYHCEPPRWVDGRMRDYGYKMLNLLIQGSAADCTKEAFIRYCERKPKHHHALLTVHDETLVSVPREERRECMELLKSCMEDVDFDVPMLSEGTWSSKSWHELRDYDVKGKLKCRSDA